MSEASEVERQSEFSEFVAEMEFALRTIWVDQPEKAERGVRLIRGAITGNVAADRRPPTDRERDDGE